MLQLPLSMLNVWPKDAGSIKIPNFGPVRLRCQTVVYPEEEKTGSMTSIEVLLSRAMR
jgi:hypothetical protein